jgi:hypothetical protein
VHVNIKLEQRKSNQMSLLNPEYNKTMTSGQSRELHTIHGTDDECCSYRSISTHPIHCQQGKRKVTDVKSHGIEFHLEQQEIQSKYIGRESDVSDL